MIDQTLGTLFDLPCLGPQETVDFSLTKLNLKEPSVTLSFKPITISQ